MIVICQTVHSTFQLLRSFLGDRKNVFLIDNHREALVYVRDNKPSHGRRTVAILSDFFPGEIGLNGAAVATLVCDVRPAWCIIYTSLRPRSGSSVVAIIDKVDRDHLGVPYDALAQLVDAGIDDPERIPDIETLFEMFPWIQRPNH